METTEALADLWATIMPTAEETCPPDLVTVGDQYDIVLAGHHPTWRPEMVHPSSRHP